MDDDTTTDNNLKGVFMIVKYVKYAEMAMRFISFVSRVSFRSYVECRFNILMSRSGIKTSRIA